MNKKILIESIKNLYNFTTKEATNYIKTIDKKHQKALIEYFNNNAKKAFYND